APDGCEPHPFGPHPAQRLAALSDQRFGQLWIGAVLSDAIHVVEELILGIRTKIGLGDLLLGEIRHERLEVLDAVVDAAHGAGGEAAIAAGLLLRRAFEHEHRHALLASCQRCTQGALAAAATHHITRGGKHPRWAPYLIQTPPYTRPARHLPRRRLQG